MNRKTILNVLIAILLCASTFASVASAAGDEAHGEDMHNVIITVDHEGEDENNMTITVEFEWEYPAQMRSMASAGDDTVDAGEATEFETNLGMASLEEIQEAHRSHVWDMSVGGAQGAAASDVEVPWTISTSVANLEGTTAEDDTSFTVSVDLSLDMNSNDLTDGNLAMTFGPLGDREGDNMDLPYWPTGVTVVDGSSWCAISVERDGGGDLTSEFAYHADDNFTFTATYSQSQECVEDTSRDDDDKDGVLNANDLCANTPADTVVDEDGCAVDQGCVEGTDTDGDGVDDCADTCTGTAAGAEVDDDGCSAEQLDDGSDDWTFDVTFTVDAAEFTCTGMNNDSTAQDCMDAAGATLAAVADVPAGHPHEWSWELQVNGVAADDQDAANMALTSQSTFAWVAKCASGSAGCADKTVFTVTELTGTLEIASGDCVFFGDLANVSFGDAWDDLDQSSRCFSADGDYTAGGLTITVGTPAGNTTGGTDPVVNDDTTVEGEESTPGFGLVVGITAALGAALIAASRKED